jgi:predicted kinase
MNERAVVLITGIQASGKSTVAQALAERLPRSVHLRSDVFRRSIVNGRVNMSPDPGDEALSQLEMRYRLTASAADTYAEYGFTVVVQDVILGAYLEKMTTLIQSRPLLVIVLAPRPEVVAAREAGRSKTAYGPYTVEDLDRGLRGETPRIGLWLDNSDQTVAETVDEILARAWTEGRI